MKSPITGSKLLISIAVLSAALMAVIDISIVNVALSDIRSTYGTALDRIGWVSTSYMMANVVVIPMTGWLQRRFGFRRYYVASIALFTVASLLCGCAWNFASLILFRVIQGIGGGAIIPTSQAILLARYPRSEHTMAAALFGLASITGPLLGPTIGGYLIEMASWHWIFYVNIPLGIFAASMAWKNIGQPDFTPSRDGIDICGIGLLIVGMASLQYVLEEGNRERWESGTIVVLAVVAGTCLVTFVVHELETEHPVVDLRVFANRNYSASTAINFIGGMGIFSSAYLFSLYCGAVMRYTALDIGLVFLAAGAIQLVLMPLVGRFGAKVDGRILLGVGMVLMILSFWLNGHLTEVASYSDLVLPQMVRSVGLGFIFVPINIMALSSLPVAKQGNASGLFNLTRELGGTIGTAWMGTLLDRHSKMHFSYLTEHVTLAGATANQQYAFLTRDVTNRLADAEGAALSLLQLKMTLQSLIKAFNDGFLNMCVIFFVGLALVLVLRRAKEGLVVEAGH